MSFLAAAGLAVSAAATAVPGSAGRVPAGSPLELRESQYDFDPTGRPRLLAAILLGPHCYDQDLTPEALAELAERTGLLPPTLSPQDVLNGRYAIDTNVWVGQAQIGPAFRAQAAQLTYSFPPDGTTWGLNPPAATGPNNLNLKLTETFGSLDRGREYVRSALAAWRRAGGITYTEVADDGSQQSQSTTRVATRGDIRIGGVDSGVNGVLAYNGFPSTLGTATIGGGDMVLNTGYFRASTFQLSTSDYRYFRNTVAHEHGHGLGMVHTIPCDRTKLMEPQIVTLFDMLRPDEIRGVQRNYGDRFSGNNSLVNARDLGNLTSPTLRSVIHKDLSTNGIGGFNFSGEDWFKFTLSSPQNLTVVVSPTGETSIQAAQGLSQCDGTTASVNGLIAGNLNVQLVFIETGGVIASGASQPGGSTETFTVSNLAAGTYAVKVFDSTANDPANQYVQTYDLTVRVNAVKAPPEAIAGIHKRVQANTDCWFNGALNSRITEVGAAISPVGYDWDIDGDGIVDSETEDNAYPNFMYVSNGVYPVTLFVTDSNSKTGRDTINVTVYGATTSITGVLPASANTGVTVPVTITGTNLKGITSSSQVTVSGGGVTVTGTPVVDPRGTQITGLSFSVAANATLSTRNISVTNSDGQGASGTGTNLFQVGVPGQPPANDECAGAFAWPVGDGAKSIINTSATTSAVQPTPSGCSISGPINTDVWYSWAAPTRGQLTVSTAGSAFPLRVAAYRNTCPSTAPTAAGCAEAGGNFVISVTTGAQLYFQVGTVTPGQNGSAAVALTLVPSLGACCATNGTCTNIIESECLAISGAEWTFAGTCNPNPCSASQGACCGSGGCVIADETGCTSAGGEWKGPGTGCQGQSGNPITCCIANFNQMDGVTVQDLFDYLDAWFTLAPAANLNGDTNVTVQDLFDYLDAWFAGCAG